METNNRVLAEQALRESEERYRTLVEAQYTWSPLKEKFSTATKQPVKCWVTGKMS
ncbi:MAG: hypothetical protein KAR44_05670 [Candidatus Aegiribacteria sp.]|nr:hypothetical protein [Candidatus Aegiribacteria sp.]